MPKLASEGGLREHARNHDMAQARSGGTGAAPSMSSSVAPVGVCESEGLASLVFPPRSRCRRLPHDCLRM